MLKTLLRKAIEDIELYCHNRGQEQHICGTGGPDDIYMIRYTVFKSSLLTVYIHRFLRSDGDDHHDHPFNFWSYVAKGGYTEELLESHSGNDMSYLTAFTSRKVSREPGSLAYRKATAVHRVIVDKDRKYVDRHQAPLTVVLLGRRWREWGFWKKIRETSFYDIREFIPWYTYLQVDPNSEKARKHQ